MGPYDIDEFVLHGRSVLLNFFEHALLYLLAFALK